MATIGVVVFTLGGTRSLETCLESKRWADSVILLHLGAGEPAVQEESSLPDSIERAFSIEQAGQRLGAMKTDWVLHLWAGERLNPRLEEAIVSLRKKGEGDSSRSYRLEIRSRLFSRWVRGSLWGASPSPRLSAELRDLSHGWWREPSAVGRAPLLPGWIEDYSVENLGHGLERLNRFSTLCAERASCPAIRFGPFSTALYSFWVGSRLLIMNRIVAQGFAGVAFAVLTGYAVLLEGAKRWERRTRVPAVQRKGRDSTADRGR